MSEDAQHHVEPAYAYDADADATRTLMVDAAGNPATSGGSDASAANQVSTNTKLDTIHDDLVTIGGTALSTIAADITAQSAGTGAQADTESTSGNGSVIGILKNLRTRIASVVTLLAGGLPAALGAGGGLKVDGSGTALPVSGTVTITDGSGPVTVDGTVAATQSGTFTVQPGNTANTTAWKVDGSAVTQPVQPPTYAAPVSGEFAVTTSAVQMASVACKYVQIIAAAANTGKVYVGVTGVTASDGSTDTTTGLELVASATTGWMPITNLNLLFVKGSAAGSVTYLALV